MPISASSTLVNVAEDAELRLVRLLSSQQTTQPMSEQFVPTCQHCIAMGDAAQLLRTILQEPAAIQAVMALPQMEEAISVISLLAALLDRVGEKDPNTATSLVHALADAVVVQQHHQVPPTTSTNGNNNTPRTITLLSTLYNMRSNPLEKCGLLVRMMQLASAAAATAAADGTLSSTSSLLEPNMPLGKLLQGTPQPVLVSWLDAWRVLPMDRRAVYAAAAQGATTTAIRQRFYIYLVETYNTTNDVIDATGLAYARETAIGAIRDPVTWIVAQRKLLSCRAIQTLQQMGSREDALLVELLSIFHQGTLQDYIAFINKNGGTDFIQRAWNLHPDKCFRYMRILSLCSLAADQEEIPYNVVATKLSTDGMLDDTQVEQLVIAAVSSGLISAKMDQLNKMVIVERCVVRKFDLEQWKGLQNRLKVWKRNVHGILHAYQQASSTSQLQGQPSSTTVTE